MTMPSPSKLALSALALSAGLSARAAFGAAPQVPPDFAPNPAVGWVAFAPRWMEPLSGQGPLEDDPAHRRISNDDFRKSGKQPTFPVGNLNSPLLKPWAREKMRPYNERVLAGKPAYPRQASCLPVGVPTFELYPVQPVYFIQSPKEVIMVWQADHQIRHVYLNVPHSAHPKPSYYGESIGHYEGDTLVVDTIGVDPRTYVDSFQTPHSDKLHVIERFHMTDGGTVLEVDVHVEDPVAFTRPWNAMQKYRRVEPGRSVPPARADLNSSTSRPGPMLEASCAENPDSLMGEDATPIPHANRSQF
jgi:hypothetical protein